jgi:RNA polymerase sigma factor (sigma-70 family)
MPNPSPTPAPDLSDEIDHAMLERAALGDAHAWEVLEGHIWSRVTTMLGRQSPDVEDIVQLVCLRIVKALEDGKGPCPGGASAAAWVATVALNAARDHRRKLLRWAKVWASDSTDAEVKAVEDVRIDKDDTAALDVALLSLSQEHREVLVMRYVDQRTFSEIATILEIPENTVKSRTTRARKALTEALEAQLWRFKR